jgi:hypothetical protein
VADEAAAAAAAAAGEGSAAGSYAGWRLVLLSECTPQQLVQVRCRLFADAAWVVLLFLWLPTILLCFAAVVMCCVLLL